MGGYRTMLRPLSRALVSRILGGRGTPTATAPDWWDAAAFSGINWLAIYQPYGAASQAASYSNLKTPGVNNAAPGTAPSWSAAAGWQFNGAANQYLTTGLTPAANWSLIAIFRNAAAATQQIAGSQGSGATRLLLQMASNSRSYGNGNALTVTGAITTGAMGVSTDVASLNGISDGTLTSSWSGSGFPIVIGARSSSGTLDRYYTGDILALALASSAMTEPQLYAAILGMYARMATGTPDIFVIAGQSNASGRGTNNQAYDQSGPLAFNFSNANVLTQLADPVDSNTGQADSVSSDTATGSVWPLVATSIMASTARSCAFVPCAKGGTSITAWLPGADHEDRTTLYGSMIYRARQAMPYGTLRCVLWWQGETDALASMSQATYNGHLDTIANAVYADLGIKLMPCRLQNSSGIGDAAEAAINAAIAEAWGDNANVLAGPDLSGLTTDDDYHLKSDENLAAAAELWWDAIKVALY